MTDKNTDTSEDDESETNSSPWGDSVGANEGSGPDSSDDSSTSGSTARESRDSEPESGGKPDSGSASEPSGSPFEESSGSASESSGNPFERSDVGDQSAATEQPSGATPGGESPESTTESESGATGEPTPPPQSSASRSSASRSSTSEGFDPTSESRRIDSETAETNTAERDRPEEVDPTLGGAFGSRNYTQDLVDVEFVFDKDDPFTPENIDSSGVVETPDGKYLGLAEVSARSWSIHTDQKKHEIIQSYQSGFLSTLDFYAQIVCYPTEFDMSDHITRLEERVREMGDSADEGDLIQIGRQLYPVWLTNFIRGNELTQRDYYVIVRVDPSDLRQFDETDSLADKVSEQAEAFAPLVRAVEGLFSSGGDEEAAEASREECIQEVHARLSRVKSALQQIDVDVDPVDDRDEALAVIYHYYNNTRPERSSFDTATRTVHDPNAPLDIDENRIDDLLRPNYEPDKEEPQS